jgi:hypothetical protein
MTVYLTKTWGFDSPSGPLVFRQNGSRKSARSVLKDGDLVVIVGTMTSPTLIEQRGKMLGLMEPTKEIANTLDYELVTFPDHFDEGGQYRWPFALELRRAWRFLEPRTLLSAVSSREFGIDSGQGIVPLTPDEATRILALPHEEVGLLHQSIRTKTRIDLEGPDSARKKAAPPPTTRRNGIMHMRRMSAFTYAMEIEHASQSAFKIGWAFDHKARARQFNLSSLPKLGGLRYKIRLERLWDTAFDAFRMEQWLLRNFDTLRHPSNREVVCPIDLRSVEAAWVEYLIKRSSPSGKSRINSNMTNRGRPVFHNS